MRKTFLIVVALVSTMAISCKKEAVKAQPTKQQVYTQLEIINDNGHSDYSPIRSNTYYK